ncbi:hypothetical protein ABZ805_18320 [Saccharopolyspora sp. NPDC047091]|uniref:hypothetical protein n=1 Tax=Saccharopolyspora sp. NPDC047091 TaxID=3155924 RepID=UPI0034092DAF
MLARWKSAPAPVWPAQVIRLVGVAVPAGFFLIALIVDPHPMVVVFSIPVLLHAALVVPPAIMLGTGAAGRGSCSSCWA